MIKLLFGACALVLLAGCVATPANEVKIPTMPMENAYNASREAQATSNQAPEARIVRAVISPVRPAPLVTAPDVRLAYAYEWTDTEGNMHYPGWIAIQVETFKWVMPDMGAVPMDGSVSKPPLAASGDLHESR